jgi:hypothetical protein
MKGRWIDRSETETKWFKIHAVVGYDDDYFLDVTPCGIKINVKLSLCLTNYKHMVEWMYRSMLS